MTHKQVKNTGQVERIPIKDHHKAIVPQEQFDRVQKIVEMKRTGQYPFMGLMTCPICGRTMRKVRPSGNDYYWACEDDRFYISVDKVEDAVIRAFEVKGKEPPLGMEFWQDRRDHLRSPLRPERPHGNRHLARWDGDHGGVECAEHLAHQGIPGKEGADGTTRQGREDGHGCRNLTPSHSTLSLSSASSAFRPPCLPSYGGLEDGGLEGRRAGGAARTRKESISWELH